MSIELLFTLFTVARQYRDELTDALDGVSIIGKNRDIMKIQTRNKDVRSNFIINIKRKKPTGLFISEFLVASKYKLFHSTRLLAKSSSCIDWVRTRNGLILYRDRDQNRSFKIENDNDLVALQNRL